MNELTTFFIVSYSSQKSAQNGFLISFQQSIKKNVWKYLSNYWKYLRKITIILSLVIKHGYISSPFQAKKALRFGWKREKDRELSGLRKKKNVYFLVYCRW